MVGCVFVVNSLEGVGFEDWSPGFVCDAKSSSLCCWPDYKASAAETVLPPFFAVRLDAVLSPVARDGEVEYDAAHDCVLVPPSDDDTNLMAACFGTIGRVCCSPSTFAPEWRHGHPSTSIALSES